LGDEFAQPRYNLIERRVLQQHFADAQLLQRRGILVRHDAAGHDDHVVGAFLLEAGKDLGEHRHLRAGQQAHSENIGIFLNGGDNDFVRRAVQALARIKTPAYLRAGRPNVPILYENAVPFTLGKANQLRDGKDVTLIANGLMLAEALKAADTLAGQGIQARVVDMHTVKPLDDDAILKAARDTGRIVVAEEHLLHGGLGSAVAMSVARQNPVPMRFVAIKDTFAESGSPEGLLANVGREAQGLVQEK